MSEPRFHSREVRHPFLWAIIAVLFSIDLQAQDRLKHVTFDVGAGFSFPTGPLAGHTRTGFNFVASAGPRLNPTFSAAVDFSLHYFNVKDSFQNGDVDLSQGAVARVWSLTINPSYQFLRREKFSSYATAGYGLYNRKLKVPFPDPIPMTACDTFWDACISSSPGGAFLRGNINPYKGGYNVGGGMDFGIRTKFFVEARYHHMFTGDSPTELIPLTFGIRW
jgi:opacity protein-like surface antigen